MRIALASRRPLGLGFVHRGLASLPALGAVWVWIALGAGWLGALRASARAPAYTWSLDETSDGIALYTSDSPYHGYDAVKAVATLSERPDTLVAILRDIAAFPRWYARCKETRVLERPGTQLPVRLSPDGKFVPSRGEESYVLFFLQSVPVVSDRWAVVRNSLRFLADGSLEVEFHSLDRYRYPAPADAERMRVVGVWTFSPLSPTRTRVSFMLDIDPVLSTPGFLVNPKLHDIAHDTVAGLRAIAPRRRAQAMHARL